MVTGLNSSPTTSNTSSDNKSGANQVATGWPSVGQELESLCSLSANDIANKEASSNTSEEFGGSSLSTKQNDLVSEIRVRTAWA
jgi:hypothetical protein